MKNIVDTKTKRCPIRGDRIPQHRLLSRKEWEYILDGRITKFTYWTTYGPYHYGNRPHHPGVSRVTIYREDYL